MSRVSENFATCKSRQRTGHFKVSFCEPATMSSSWLAVCFTDDESQTGVQRQRRQQNSLFAAISALLLNFPFRNRSTSCSGVVTSTSITIMKYFCWEMSGDAQNWFRISYLGRCWLLAIHINHLHAVGRTIQTNVPPEVRWWCRPRFLLHTLEVHVQLRTIHTDFACWREFDGTGTEIRSERTGDVVCR